MKINIPGQSVTPGSRSDGFGAFADILGGRVVHETNVSAPERGRAMRGAVSADVDPQDVLELHWQGGIVELVPGHGLDARFRGVARSAEGDFTIPVRDASKGVGRGGDGFLLEAVKHLQLDAVKGLTQSAAATLISTLESKYIYEPGVHAIRDGGVADRISGLAAVGTPYLVLLHGTFSSTVGSFHDLFKSPDWKRLTDRYGDRVVGLEQRTLTDSPARNAIELVKALPRNATVHLLSHSRGGLVGELLCRYPWSDVSIAQYFGNEEYKAQREELAELAHLLEDKKPRVERFARVACPAAGTILASERLDAYLNVILTLLAKLTGAASPAFSFVKAVALAIVSARAKADLLPGLEAMMPHLEKGFVPFLNAPDWPARESDDLAIIAGDVQGGGLFDRLKAFFSDLYFREDNDFVVDGKSMFRGVPRVQAKGYYLRSPGANHFSYFSMPETRACATDLLLEAKSANLRDIRSSELYGGLRSTSLRSIPKKNPGEPTATGLPVVFLLPGIMGSHISREKKRIWLSVFALSKGGLADLEIDDQSIEADGLLERYYERLFDHLSRDYRVEPFAFDWRRPIAEAAERLFECVERELAAHDRTVRLIAHSMGGLVCRAFIAAHRTTWDKMVARGGRLVMLGTPNYGSYVPAQVLTEQHNLMRWLARADVKHDLAKLTEIVGAYSGLLEMLPLKNNDNDLLSPAAWAALGGKQPDGKRLSDARVFREKLAADGLDPANMVYVAGRALETPVAVQPNNGKIEFLYSSRGDGTVPWELGRIDGVRTYYVRAEHGQIPNHEPSFEGFSELLATGKTTKLAEQPPQARDLDEKPHPSKVPFVEPRYYPSGEDFAALILGSPAQVTDRVVQPIAISVKNCDVSEAKHPVMVGHYLGDKLVSVERILDRRLGGELSTRQRLGAYPGEIGTHLIEKGAIVVGIGLVNDLTPAKLRDTATRALVEHALQELRKGTSVELAIGVSTVLVGTYGGGRISVEACVDAICGAAIRANTALEQATGARRVRISELEFIEIYEDIATDAAHATHRVAEKSGEALAAAPLLEQKLGSLRSRPRSPYASGWSRRVAIRVGDSDVARRKRRASTETLTFDVATDLARTEPYPREVDFANVEPLLKQAVRSDGDARSILFRYLVPYQLVGEIQQGTDLVLDLDPFTATLPWELLGPVEADVEPLGVRFGVLRQLRSEQRRESPKRSLVRRALVIGNPAGVVPDLPGATKEAEEVAKLLSGVYGFEVTECVKSTADEIFSALWKTDYDFIHIAAHGILDDKDANGYGVVLGDGRILKSSAFDFPVVPSVVFLNCCHLGAFGRQGAPSQPGELAANVAEHLIRMGVRVVVAAGWAVSDDPAATFATALYKQLLDGRTLMDSVRNARLETFRACGLTDVTWGAYQVYGSDGFSLPGTQAPEVDVKRAAGFVSAQEFLDFISDYNSRSRGVGQDRKRRDDLLQELSDLEASLPPSFRERGDIAYAIGTAYGELRAFDLAIDRLTEASKSSETPLGAIEQMANFEARQAKELRSSNPERALALLDSSAKRLAAVIAVQPTPERHALLGACLRRRAAMTKDTRDRASLAERSYEEYKKACALSPTDYDKALNAAQMLLVVDATRLRSEDLDAVVVNANQAKPTLASRVTAADAELIRYAAGISKDLQEVVKAYRKAFTEGAGSTPHERQFAGRNLDRLAELVIGEVTSGRVRQVAAEVGKLE